MDYSLAELLSFARRTVGAEQSAGIARAEDSTVSALITLAAQALNGSDANTPAARIPIPSLRSTATHSCESDFMTELQQELRLLEKETGIALAPAAPIASYVRAVAVTGNAHAQQLLARLKAALTPPL